MKKSVTMREVKAAIEKVKLTVEDAAKKGWVLVFSNGRYHWNHNNEGITGRGFKNKEEALWGLNRTLETMKLLR